MSASTSSSTNATATSNYFAPITKSSSVPDIHKNSDNATQNNGTDSKANGSGKNENKGSRQLDRKQEPNTLLVTRSDSIESAMPSPAGSLEQFEVSGFNNSTLPLTPDDATDSMIGETTK